MIILFVLTQIVERVAPLTKIIKKNNLKKALLTPSILYSIHKKEKMYQQAMQNKKSWNNYKT